MGLSPNLKDDDCEKDDQLVWMCEKYVRDKYFACFNNTKEN